MKKLIPILSLLIISVAGFAQTQTKRTIQIWDNGAVQASRDIQFVDSITILTESLDNIISPFDEFGNNWWEPYLSADANHGNPLIGDMTHSTSFDKLFADNDYPDEGSEVWHAVLFAQPELGTYNADKQFPLYITIDLGRVVTIDSFLFKCRERNATSGDNQGLGSSRYATDFEVWGSTSPINPALTDTVQSLNYWTSWTGSALTGQSTWQSDGSWTKLHTGTLESILPSGYKYHNQWTIPSEDGEGKVLSEEDQAAILAGFKFDLDGTTEVRYIRFKILNTSSGTQVNEWQYLELHGTEK